MMCVACDGVCVRGVCTRAMGCVYACDGVCAYARDDVCCVR